MVTILFDAVTFYSFDFVKHLPNLQIMSDYIFALEMMNFIVSFIFQTYIIL